VSTAPVDPSQVEPGRLPVPDEEKGGPHRFAPGTEIGKETRYRKGESGNPSGRPKDILSVRDVEAKALKKMDSVLLVWELILLDGKAQHKDRIRAGECIANYGCGRPRQSIQVSGEEGKPPIQVDAITGLLERMLQLGPAALANAPSSPVIDVEAVPVPAAAGPADQTPADDEAASASQASDGRAA